MDDDIKQIWWPHPTFSNQIRQLCQQIRSREVIPETLWIRRGQTDCDEISIITPQLVKMIRELYYILKRKGEWMNVVIDPGVYQNLSTEPIRLTVEYVRGVDLVTAFYMSPDTLIEGQRDYGMM